MKNGYLVGTLVILELCEKRVQVGSRLSYLQLLSMALEEEMMECYKRGWGRKEGADGGDFYLYLRE